MEMAQFKDGPPTCPERNIVTDEYGQEWVDLEKILKSLDVECSECDKSD